MNKAHYMRSSPGHLRTAQGYVRGTHHERSMAMYSTLTSINQPTFPMKEYLAHKKHLSRRTLKQPYAQGPLMILGWWVFLMSEVPP